MNMYCVTDEETPDNYEIIKDGVIARYIFFSLFFKIVLSIILQAIK